MPLKDRTLRISKDKAGFEYRYYKTIKCGFLKLKTCRDEVVDFYNLSDPIVRKQLIEIGFVLKVREQI